MASQARQLFSSYGSFQAQAVNQDMGLPVAAKEEGGREGRVGKGDCDGESCIYSLRDHLEAYGSHGDAETKRSYARGVIIIAAVLVLAVGLAASVPFPFQRSRRTVRSLGSSAAAATTPPGVALQNAADEGVVMPWIGLGTGGYGADAAVGYGGYPECFAEDHGCGAYAARAVSDWLDAGGRRLDCSNSYRNERVIGDAIAGSGVPREDIFITSKVGPSLPLGYQDALDQFDAIKRDLRTDYVDLLLIHWPQQDKNVDLDPEKAASKDPACHLPGYNATQCRLNTWQALVEIWRGGGARAIGVSNYYKTHLEEIVSSGLPLPAVNQNPFHLYRSSAQHPTLDLCRQLGIVFNGYSPLGVPDWHTFPAVEKDTDGGEADRMSPKQLDDPAVLSVARALGATPAQTLLVWQWQLGVPVNPRSQNRRHMEENLEAHQFKLTADQVEALSSRPQDWCSIDPHFYQCVPDETSDAT